MTVTGAFVSFSGLDVDDDNDEDEDENKLPPGWIAGAIVTLKAPVNYQVSIEGGFNVLTGRRRVRDCAIQRNACHPNV